MRRFFTRALLGLAAALFVGLAGQSARADLILMPNESAPQGGVGKKPESALSIQSPKNTDNAFGGVAWNGSRDVISGQIAK